MPNGNTAMQYPFPYKNISGSSDIITSGTFIIVTTGTLSVLGDANISGTTTTSILVVTGTATSAAWDGSNNVNANDFSSQTNTSTGNAAAATYRVYNGSDDTFDFSIYSRAHSTYPGLALLLTSRSIKIHSQVAGQTIKLTTNFIDRLTVSDTGVVLSAPLPIASGGTGIPTLGTVGQVLTSTGTTLEYTSPTTGTVTSVAASVPSFLNVTAPITSTGTLAISYSGTALPVLNGGTGVVSSSGANSVVIRDSSQNISVNQLTSSVTTGTQPLVVSSSTLVGNLNANYLNGVGFASPAISTAVALNSSAQFISIANTGSGNNVLQTSPTFVTPVIGDATGTSLSVTGQLTSTVATGTSPLSVSSTTIVGNLNANYLNGVGFAAPAVSSAVELNSSAQFVTASITGTGSFVKSASPTLTGTLTAATGTFSGNVTAASYVGSTTTFSAATTVDISFDTTTYRKIEIDLYIGNSANGGNIFIRTAAGTPDGFSIIRRATTSTEIRSTDGTFMNGPNSGDNGGSGTINIYRPVTATTGQVQVWTTGTYYYTGDGPAAVNHYMLFAQNYSTTIRITRDNGNMTGSYTIRNFS